MLGIVGSLNDHEEKNCRQIFLTRRISDVPLDAISIVLPTGGFNNRIDVDPKIHSGSCSLSFSIRHVRPIERQPMGMPRSLVFLSTNWDHKPPEKCRSLTRKASDAECRPERAQALEVRLLRTVGGIDQSRTLVPMYGPSARKRR